MKRFRIVSVNISQEKSVSKKPVPCIELIAGYGIRGDAHAGDHHRQVSLLAMEDIETARVSLASLMPGDFAENITTQGIDLPFLPIGTRLYIGEVVLEITQIGKQCHKGCAIQQQIGDCVMPKRGVFARVIQGGMVNNEIIGTYGI